jgi:hypothetical protein
MVPMYAARVEHLTNHETVTALCAACGHVAEVLVAALWRKFPPFKRVGKIRLWCTRCGERDRVELDATKALSASSLGGWRGDGAGCAFCHSWCSCPHFLELLLDPPSALDRQVEVIAQLVALKRLVGVQELQ